MSTVGDHAIVGEVSDDDDAAVLAKLAALDAEVKAEADKHRVANARKAEIIAELRRREAAKKAAEAPMVAPTAAPEAAPKPVAQAKPKPVAQAKPKPQPRPKPPPEDEDDDVSTADALETAMTVARGAKVAQRAKAELSKPREKHEKSWIGSGLASLVLGPVGWLYAGSFREAIPAAFFYLVLATIMTKLPFFLIMPVLMVAMPISAIGGVVYAVQYNRHGKRQRLFGKEPEAAKQLPAGAKQKR